MLPCFTPLGNPGRGTDATRSPVSPEPMMPLDHRPASDSGFSFRLLKLSTTGSGSTGGSTVALGVAGASFEESDSPTALLAFTR